MLRTDWDKKICAEYSAFDKKDGKVHCYECPLRLPQIAPYGACKATHHWNKEKGEWVADEKQT